MATESVDDYQNKKVSLVDEYCDDCDAQLNTTELKESKEHINDDKVFCTKHLHDVLAIPN